MKYILLMQSVATPVQSWLLPLLTWLDWYLRFWDNFNLIWTMSSFPIFTLNLRLSANCSAIYAGLLVHLLRGNKEKWRHCHNHIPLIIIHIGTFYIPIIPKCPYDLKLQHNACQAGCWCWCTGVNKEIWRHCHNLIPLYINTNRSMPFFFSATIYTYSFPT